MGKILRAIVVIYLTFITTHLLTSSVLASASPTSTPDLHLSQLAKDDHMLGIMDEPFDEIKKIRSNARSYADILKGRLRGKKGQKVMNDCKTAGENASNSNPFCTLLLNLENPQKKRLMHEPKALYRIRVKKLASHLKSGNFQELGQASLNELNDALKQIVSLKEIDSTLKSVLTEKQCTSTSLILALGLRIEVEFPDDSFKKLAVLLYEKAQTCKRDIYTDLSSYRLGLLQIWNNKYKEAESTLSKIMEGPLDPSYRLRAAYWRHHCAVQLKDKTLKENIQKWLTREYPLSLHGLLVNPKLPSTTSAQFAEQDPVVRLRSTKMPFLNSKLRMIEALLLENEKKLAANLLVSDLEMIYSMEESPFQLYWAVLLDRVAKRPAAFELMARIFRADPQMLSKETLALMYPLQETQAIGRVETELDPYLLLSVIRQESAFNPHAKSTAGALGLMQLQLRTARHFERLSKSELFIPHINVRVGVKYLKQLLRLFHGEAELALAAYNAGPGRLNEWLKRYPIENRLLFIDFLPTRETRDYISSILRNYYWYSKLYGNTFGRSPAGKKIPTQEFQLLEKPLQEAKSN